MAASRQHRRSDSTVRVGRLAEGLAARYLALRGYRVLDRNVRVGHDELDLVALHTGWLVVVEVRYRADPGPWSPDESLDPRKRYRLLRAGRTYWEQWHGLAGQLPPSASPGTSRSAAPSAVPSAPPVAPRGLAREGAPRNLVHRLRFDLVAISGTETGLQLQHYQHVVRPSAWTGPGVHDTHR